MASVRRIHRGASFGDVKKAIALNTRATAHAVASAAAPLITRDAQHKYDGFRTVYEEPRKPWRRDPPGTAVPDLRASGATRRAMHFTTAGGTIQVVLGTPYAKFLIGKYAILPSGNAFIPHRWVDSLNRVNDQVLAGVALRRGGR